MSIKVFISYSWDSDEHKRWVKKLSDDLESAGIETILDQKDMVLGDSIPHFMEKSITESDYVLLILTPKYKEKADRRIGGVGYEDAISISEVSEKRNHRKYIPILADGNWKVSMPLWAKGKFGVDMTTDYYRNGLNLLLDTLQNGTTNEATIEFPPEISITSNNHQTNSSATNKFKVIKIVRPNIKKLVNDYIAYGDDCFEEHGYSDAILEYTKAINLDPHSARLYEKRAFAYDWSGNNEKALEDYNKAIELSPNLVTSTAYCYRGYILFSIGKYVEALEDLNIAIIKSPNNANYYYNRGRIYQALGKDELSQIDFEKAQQLLKQK